MWELQKIFLLLRFFNRISCNKGSKAKILFFMFFLFNPPWGWNVLEAERPLRSAHHIGWRNTKIYIHESSWMEQKCGKCWKLPIFEGKLQVFISYLTKMKIVYSITLLYSSTFYSLLYHFLFLRYLNSSMTWFSWDDLRMGLTF